MESRKISKVLQIGVTNRTQECQVNLEALAEEVGLWIARYGAIVAFIEGDGDDYMSIIAAVVRGAKRENESMVPISRRIEEDGDKELLMSSICDSKIYIEKDRFSVGSRIGYPLYPLKGFRYFRAPKIFGYIDAKTPREAVEIAVDMAAKYVKVFGFNPYIKDTNTGLRSLR